MSRAPRRNPVAPARKQSAAAGVSGPAATIRIALADDHAVFRSSLRKRLAAERDFDVIGEASSPDEAVALCEQTQPDLLLLDVEMAGRQGLDVLRRLRPLQLRTRILILTIAITRADLVSALQLGARGAVLKDTPSSLLFKSIRRVRAGEFWIGRDMVADLVHALAAAERGTMKPAIQAPRAFALTARELEIVSAVAAGYSNKEMAEKFGVAEDTVKHHLTSIFDKTGVSNRLELALFALHHRLA